MNVKKIALLFGALLIAAVTAVMAKNMFTGAGANQASAATAVAVGPKVLVARKSLPAGSIVDAESISFQAWPKELVQNAYYTEGAPEADPRKLIGTVVRNPITAGQPITQGALVGPNDRGFLAAALGPGMRAVTVPVSTTTGVAGFVFPGDRVDIVLTQEVVGGGDGPPLKVSETIVRNMRVLATDQRIDSKDEEGKTEVKTFTNVTLEATPKIAEKIAVGQSLGMLSLSLRSIADSSAELERAVAAGEVRVPNGATPAQERQMMLAIASRPNDNATTYTTGGDVSRFQRSSIPGRKKEPGAQGNDALSSFASALAGRGAGDAGAGAPAVAVSSGPVVRVARGNSITIVPVGAR